MNTRKNLVKLRSNIIKKNAKLKKSDPQKWFCWLKGFTTKEQLKEKEIVINEISHMTHENHAEVFADSSAKISQEYDSLTKENTHIPYFTSEWKQAFPRQCPKLGVEAFIAMGIRPSLIPVLMNYFQNREMKVKWKGIFSKVRPMPGRGPQGTTFGNLEYSAQSNENADMVDIEDRYKFVDDLTTLETVNLLCTQITYI